MAAKKRGASAMVLMLGLLLAGCGGPGPSQRTATPSMSAGASVPSSVVPAPLGHLWRSQQTDPAPGPVVTGIIATTLGLTDAHHVVAAVFLLDHPAGNTAEVWVFRAADHSSSQAVDAWAGTESDCGGPERSGQLAGMPAVIVHREFVDQCQPRYLVQLDDETVAIITDDGGYSGNVSPSTVPYRPTGDIDWIVRWLQRQLETVELQPGGDAPVQG